MTFDSLKKELIAINAQLSFNIRQLALEEVRVEVIKLCENSTTSGESKQVLKQLHKWITSKQKEAPK